MNVTISGHSCTSSKKINVSPETIGSDVNAVKSVKNSSSVTVSAKRAFAFGFFTKLISM